jgi:hypothetical protein
MAQMLRPAEVAFLSSLADHRLLTSAQLSNLHALNQRTARRTLQTLCDAGLAEAVTQIGVGRGRPERVLAITRQGITHLRGAGILDPVSGTKAADSRRPGNVDHQLLINWFRIRLIQMERLAPQIKTRFLSSTAPPSNSNTIHAGSTATVELIPDGIIAISHYAQQKTLLFFLEADMGTEPIASDRAGATDIRRKVTAYQAWFIGGTYKQYEQAFCSPLKGFRVLLLAHGNARLDALCRSVCRWPDTDFIWLADQAQMHAHGLGAPIWLRGGNTTLGPHSILGNAMPKSMAIKPAKKS